ncbi:hypothetical protein CBS101457_004337 [Exobasidium rhododendri]|nr:hypothetical protein CBS101457_004337 [Exobasidium rhododendri]
MSDAQMSGNIVNLHPVESKIDFPALFTESLEKKGLSGIAQSRNIWQRMESSSSNSSDGCFGSSPDSNKENRDPREVSQSRNDHEEDEEQTLRKIAGRRAARDSARKEENLSKEGKRYLLEADARLALQQRRSSNGTTEGRKMLSSTLSSTSRPWNRAASDAQIKQKNRAILSRVPSLDMTAGRDRSKDDERPSYASLFQMRAAKRAFQSSISQDENTVPASLSSRSTKQGNKRAKYSSLQQDSAPLNRMSQDTFLNSRPNTNPLRRFAPSLSLPNSVASHLLSSRLNAPFAPFFPAPSRVESARESSARLDGPKQQGPPSHSSSQESSEVGSDDWLEAWTSEKRRANSKYPIARESNVLKDRSNILVSQSKGDQHALTKHNDSGFYGSDSGGEEEEEEEDRENNDVDRPQQGSPFKGRLGGRKRHLIHQAASSSSPSKRGDDRDRLAAETLLGLGSRA